MPNCSKLQNKSEEEKIKFIKEERHCFGCLRTGHGSKECPDRHLCQICRKKHPTILHREVNQTAQEKAKLKPEVEANAFSTCRGTSSTTNVIPVWVSTKDSPQAEKLVYALLDTQSDSTFIDEGICTKLASRTEPVKLKLTTLLGKDVIVECKKASNLRIRGYTSSQYIDLPPTFTQDFIPLDREHIPTCDTARSWSHLESLTCDIPPLLDVDIGLLIGYNCSNALIPRQVISGDDNEPYAVRTDLGWSIVGRISQSETKGFCHRVSIKEVPLTTPRDALNLLEKDFKDTNCNDKPISQEDIQFIQTLEKSIHTNENGHLEMPLPFKARPRLPNNHSLALIRLNHLKRRFDKDPQYKEEYKKFIQKMVEDGDCEQISGGNPEETWYIPHHGVMHPQKKKLRVVFDCSAKFAGTSLNEHLLQGPDLINDLFGILCRFRKHKLAIVCVIEKMFHRFHVNVEDRTYLRFLWWEDGNTNLKLKEYRMNVHFFGATSSPGCANFALKHLASSHEIEYPKASEFLCYNFYVDDGLISVSTV